MIHLDNSSRPICLFTHITPVHVKSLGSYYCLYGSLAFNNSFKSKTALDFATQGFSLASLLIASVFILPLAIY